MQLSENMGKVFSTAVNTSSSVSAFLGSTQSSRGRGPRAGLHTVGTQEILSELSKAQARTHVPLRAPTEVHFLGR